MKILIESMMLKFRTASAATGESVYAGWIRTVLDVAMLLLFLKLFQTVSELGQNTVDSYCSTKELLGFSHTKNYC